MATTKKMAVCNYAATYAISVVWKRLSLLSCLSHWLTDDMTFDRLHVYELEKGEPFGKRGRFQNTTKIKYDQ